MSSWDERWPPERRIAYIRDRLSESAISLVFEAIMHEEFGKL